MLQTLFDLIESTHWRDTQRMLILCDLLEECGWELSQKLRDEYLSKRVRKCGDRKRALYLLTLARYWIWMKLKGTWPPREYNWQDNHFPAVTPLLPRCYPPNAPGLEGRPTAPITPTRPFLTASSIDLSLPPE